MGGRAWEGRPEKVVSLNSVQVHSHMNEIAVTKPMPMHN